MVKKSGYENPDTQASFTIKLYHSQKTEKSEFEWEHEKIELRPENPDYPVLIVDPDILDLSLDEFLLDRKTQDAVIRNIEVFGQTIKDFGTDDLKSDYPEISWHQIAGMRNIIAHEYLGIDLLLVWETINKHFLPLKKILEEIISSAQRVN